jgi:hypothetical protein
MATTNSYPGKIKDYCANDPFGNFVIIPQKVKDLENNTVSMEKYFDPSMDTISDPVFILDMQDDEISYYYYRKTEGESSILIGVKKAKDHYEASCFQVNPTPAQLSILFKKAKQIH